MGNVVERLVQAHDMKLEVLEEAASSFIQDNALLFQVSFASSYSSTDNVVRLTLRLLGFACVMFTLLPLAALLAVH